MNTRYAPDDTFKMKFRGQKILCRIMGPKEKIGEHCLFSWPLTYQKEIEYDVLLERLADRGPQTIDWHISEAIGDTVRDHPYRIYVEVLSKWFH